MESEVRELLTEEIRDAYSAEKQALRCMQKALKMASAPALREGIQLHIEQTEAQIERVEQVMEKLEVKPGRKVCEAMRGLVEEAQHEISEQDGKGPILDLVIVASMQRIEHYEIAAYGTDIALAKALGENEVVDLLTLTLEEEKDTDRKLTRSRSRTSCRPPWVRAKPRTRSRREIRSQLAAQKQRRLRVTLGVIPDVTVSFH
jgi:ferritin-like metal-binding protein YciE